MRMQVSTDDVEEVLRSRPKPLGFQRTFRYEAGPRWDVSIARSTSSDSAPKKRAIRWINSWIAPPWLRLTGSVLYTATAWASCVR